MEGEPGTGQDRPGRGARRDAWTLPLIRLQCYEGIDATQALYDWDFPRQILHVRALEAVEGAARDVREVEQGLFDERFLLARPVLRALRDAPGRAAHRRDRPGRRRVRGLPARGALDLAGDHPRARHGDGDGAAGGRAHLQPHPRAARRPQAPLPLPLARAPRHRARARDRRAAALPRCRRRWPSRSSARCTASGPTARCSSRRASPRPSTGRAPCTSSGTRELDTETAAATLGVAVKYREDAERVKKALDVMLTR